VGDTASYTPGKPRGTNRHFSVDVRNLAAGAHATVWRLDENHGNAVAAFDQMGRPDFPSRAQIAALRKAGEMAPPERVDLHDGKLQLDIPPQGLVVVELR